MCGLCAVVVPERGRTQPSPPLRFFLLPFPPWDLDSDAELEVCICRKTVGYRIWLPCFWAPRKPRTLLRQLSLWHSCCLSVVRAPHPHPASFALTKQMLHHTLCLSLFSKPEVVQENNNMSGMDNGLLLLSDESLAPGYSVAATVVCDHNERPGCPAALVQPGGFFSLPLTLSAGGKRRLGSPSDVVAGWIPIPGPCEARRTSSSSSSWSQVTKHREGQEFAVGGFRCHSSNKQMGICSH